MGNSESSGNINYENYAYRIITVFEGSPAQEAGLEPQLDFIKYNPQAHGDKLFSEFLSERLNSHVTLVIYNIIQQGTRTVKVHLKENWSATLTYSDPTKNTTNAVSTNDQSKKSLLGASIRYEDYVDAHNYILAVRDVYLDSPAHEAELHPFQDYIIGTREISFKSLEDFAKYIEINQNQEVTLHVYNVDTEKVREVNITPKKGWGGQGLLGCDVSFGYYNKIPLRQIDRDRLAVKENLIGVFGKLTGDKPKKQSQSEIQSVSSQVSEVSKSQITQNSVSDSDMRQANTVGSSMNQPSSISPLSQPETKSKPAEETKAQTNDNEITEDIPKSENDETSNVTDTIKNVDQQKETENSLIINDKDKSNDKCQSMQSSKSSHSPLQQENIISQADEQMTSLQPKSKVSPGGTQAEPENKLNKMHSNGRESASKDIKERKFNLLPTSIAFE